MKQCRQHSFKSLPRHQQGAVLILVVAAMTAILMMAALALDGGHMLMNKARLQNAVDAAALSGAKTLSQLEGDGTAYLKAEQAALATFTLNAKALGNKELLKAMGMGTDAAANFTIVEFASSVYGPFYGSSSYPSGSTAPASYVRVSVPSYGLAGFFWGFVQSFDDSDLGDKAVAAIATAGPSPTAAPCDLAPIVVCGVNNPGTYFGYEFGDLEVLKTAANDESLANGNYQLLDFGAGASTVGDLMAGGGHTCPLVGQDVTTKPGNTVGQAISGLNTRFGDYTGDFKKSASDYPPDYVIDYSKVGESPALELTDAGVIEYSGTSFLVQSDAGGNIYYLTDGSARIDLLDYQDWKDGSDTCMANNGVGCAENGAFERRILKVVVGNCAGLKGGATQVPVLGFGCFFLVQPGVHAGSDAQIFGQFVKECEGDGVAGPTPATDAGPQIIQLYKTYIDNSRTPSTDS
ncbi:pilus assembly protein [Azotobacter chroococcum subsp. isscasi]|nr:TadE/TadG family type IV pilus assembly protein [Azotobacter chroococcum]TBW09598.1 pilus assembly protein [Azotobacter chroococcum subsp. isscasi]